MVHDHASSIFQIYCTTAYFLEKSYHYSNIAQPPLIGLTSRYYFHNSLVFLFCWNLSFYNHQKHCSWCRKNMLNLNSIKLLSSYYWYERERRKAIDYLYLARVGRIPNGTGNRGPESDTPVVTELWLSWTTTLGDGNSGSSTLSFDGGAICKFNLLNPINWLQFKRELCTVPYYKNDFITITLGINNEIRLVKYLT